MATKKTAEKSAAKKSAAPAKTAAKKTAADKAPSAAKKTATHAEIAALAHKYYTERSHGHNHGKHVDDWLRAEKELNS